MVTEQLKETQLKLHRTLVKLLNEHSYHQISVTKLCCAAQIHRSTFYEYYENMDQLLDEIEDEFMSHIPFLDCHANESESRTLVLEFVNYVRDHSDIFIALINSQRLMEPFTEQSRKTAHLVNRKKQASNRKTREDLLVTYTVTGSIALIKAWILHHPRYCPEKIAKMIIQLSQRAAFLLED